ncbi:MAG: hypothetical protein U1E43_06915, partial [Rhodospirillales bacterium]
AGSPAGGGAVARGAVRAIFPSMTTRKRPRRRKAASPLALPLMLGEMTLASLETIARRSWMMAQGRCSAAEYRRMGAEKAEAALASATALARPPGKRQAVAVLALWHRRATANAKRLRKK